MNYVEIPFLAHLAFGKDRGLQFFLHAGPQIGFLLGDSEKIDGDWEMCIRDRHMGMRKRREGDFPIGNGYYMNDYIMGLEI